MPADPTTHDAPTLNDVLRHLGYTTEPAGLGQKRLRCGDVEFTGTAGEVWAWLAETGQWPAAVEAVGAPC